MDTPNHRNKPPYLCVALVSAVALAYEILLMRLFSIIQWHHYAYMIISLALLGYGVSGAFIAIARTALLRYFVPVYLVNIYLFGFSCIVCFLLVQQIAFNPQEMLWDPGQGARLSLAYMTLSVPFFFAANVVALAMVRYGRNIARVYAFDLLGAGIGCLAILMLLFLVLPLSALYILGGFAMLLTLLATWELCSLQGGVAVCPGAWLRNKTTHLSLIAVVVGLGVIMVSPADLQVSPYKSLSQALQLSGSRVLKQYSSPLASVTVVENREIPMRHAPGLSLNADGEPLEQLGVFVDGDGMSVITRYPKSLDSLRYLNQMTSALPYHLQRRQQVLIAEAGTGGAVLQALLNEAGRISVVESNPQLIRLMQQDYARYSGDIYRRSQIEVYPAELRGFLTTNRQQRFDLIQLSLLDAYGASGGGAYSLHESYLYTVDALQTYFSHLQDNGYLVISRWVSLPPRDSLKLFASAIEALRASGIEQVDQHLLFIRSWQTTTLLIKKTPLLAGEIRAMNEFCERYAFDRVYYPGIQAQQSNRFNQLRIDHFYSGTQALLGAQAQAYRQQYKFNIQPASDERPYFFNFFKWTSLAEILSLRAKGGMGLLESGYLVLLVVLLQALLASVVLILLPHFLLLRRSKAGGVQVKRRILFYFAALGLAFLFIEIAFIHKFVLLLQHPVYSASVVLCGFLVFAGLGSAWSKRQLQRYRAKILAVIAIGGISLIACCYLLLFTLLFDALMHLSLWLKFSLTLMLIAPLAFFMGIPFPLALSRLEVQAPELIPWAWGINGCASVVSAVLATLLAMHAGYSAVIMTALVLYWFAYWQFPAQADETNV